jgi:molybdate transport system substrate-binding protein
VLNVSAAMTLKGVFKQLAPEFEAANDARIVFNFGASGVLQKQIEGGADVDVFASAAPKQIDALIAGGFVSADATTSFASNQVVILVPKGNPSGVQGPEDLKRVGRIATGNTDSTPIGATAKEWLHGLGLWEVVEPAVVFGENVGQVMGYLERGEVDAAVLFASEATGRENVEVAYRAPVDETPPIRYVIAPVGSTRKALLARAFIDFVMAEGSQQALVDGGFLRYPPAP